MFWLTPYSGQRRSRDPPHRVLCPSLGMRKVRGLGLRIRGQYSAVALIVSLSCVVWAGSRQRLGGATGQIIRSA
jgi:hypothetical protein